jgi:hypothetical protein
MHIHLIWGTFDEFSLRRRRVIIDIKIATDAIDRMRTLMDSNRNGSENMFCLRYKTRIIISHVHPT